MQANRLWHFDVLHNAPDNEEVPPTIKRDMFTNYNEDDRVNACHWPLPHTARLWWTAVVFFLWKRSYEDELPWSAQCIMRTFIMEPMEKS